MAARHRLAIVVVTSGHPHRLTTLRGLVDATLGASSEVEIVIVDQSGRVDSALPLDSHARIKHVPTTKRGVSESRNLGALRTEADYILFLDDDVAVGDQTIEAVVALTNESGADFFALGVTSADVERPIVRLKRMRHLQPLEPSDVLRSVVEFAIVVRASTVHQFRFDESMGVGSGSILGADEGPDLVMRLINSGKQCVAAHSIEISHPADVVDTSSPNAYARTFLYSCARGALIKRYRLYRRDTLLYVLRPVGGAGQSLLRLDARNSILYSLKIVGFTFGFFIEWALRLK